MRLEASKRMTDKKREPWHLDKRVPVALILTLMFQTFGAIWWAATMSERMNSLEREVQSREGQDRRLTRLETTVENIEKIAQRIADKIDN